MPNDRREYNRRASLTADYAFGSLNETLFASLAHARSVLQGWMDDYNTVRPYSRLGNVPPAIYRTSPEGNN
jgi:transposase InsO family protein